MVYLRLIINILLLINFLNTFLKLLFGGERANRAAFKFGSLEIGDSGMNFRKMRNLHRY